jgi:hypothetical protein
LKNSSRCLRPQWSRSRSSRSRPSVRAQWRPWASPSEISTRIHRRCCCQIIYKSKVIMERWIKEMPPLTLTQLGSISGWGRNNRWMLSMGHPGNITTIRSMNSSDRQIFSLTHLSLPEMACHQCVSLWNKQLNTDRIDSEKKSNCSFQRLKLASSKDSRWHTQPWKLSKSSWTDTKPATLSPMCPTSWTSLAISNRSIETMWLIMHPICDVYQSMIWIGAP